MGITTDEILASLPDDDEAVEPVGGGDLKGMEIIAEKNAEGDDALDDDMDAESAAVDDANDEADLPDDAAGDDAKVHEVTVDGKKEMVSVNEMKAGYQRMKDYTQKTQELSRRVKEVDRRLATGLARESKVNDWLKTVKGKDPEKQVAAFRRVGIDINAIVEAEINYRGHLAKLTPAQKLEIEAQQRIDEANEREERLNQRERQAEQARRAQAWGKQIAGWLPEALAAAGQADDPAIRQRAGDLLAKRGNVPLTRELFFAAVKRAGEQLDAELAAYNARRNPGTPTKKKPPVVPSAPASNGRRDPSARGASNEGGFEIHRKNAW